MGLRRQDAGASGEAGPRGESRMRRVNRTSDAQVSCGTIEAARMMERGATAGGVFMFTL